MENYPFDSIYQQVPVLAVVGLTNTLLNENSTEPRLQSQILEPNLNSPLTSIKGQLIQYFTEQNKLNAWDVFRKNIGFFHAIFFERDRLIRPRKINTNPNVHSEISPLNPNSPLYPKGIMTTLWVQKYTTQIPCTMLLFTDMYEYNVNDQSGIQERDYDKLITSEIIERKKNCQERGIKLVVIVMIKYHETELSRIDEKVSFYRKTCNLDAKNTIFVLPYGSNPVELLTSIKKTIYEPSVNYYRELNRRIKKKKSKHVPSNPIFSPGTLPLQDGSLSLSGWNVRYDLKSAFIAEFRQDMDIAIKNYENAYLELRNMFNSDPTNNNGSNKPILEPNSKEWNDGKMIADCINIKICQLYLYKEQPLSAFSQFQTHLQKYKTLPEYINNNSNYRIINRIPKYVRPESSNGTIQYWAWMTIQMKAFSELIELAQHKLGLNLPYPTLNYKNINSNVNSSSLLHSYSNSSLAELENDLYIQKNITDPNMFIQQAGFYYLLTSQCVEERWNCFKILQKESTERELSAEEKNLLNSESQIDYASVIIDILKKAYEQFKNQKNGRMTLYLARNIAKMYEEKNNYEIALKFYDRISKTYRNENWNVLLTDILKLIVKCSKETHSYQILIESLVELLSGDMGLEFSERIEIQDELLGLISGSIPFQMNEDPLNNRNIHIKLNNINSFVSCKVKFNKSETLINTPAKFQLSLNTNNIKSPAKPITFSKLLINFNDPNFNICLYNNEDIKEVTFNEVSDGENFRRIKNKNGLITEWINIKDLKHETVKTNFGSEDFLCKTVNLSLCSNMRKIFEGEINTDTPIDLKVVSVSLIIESAVSNLILTADDLEQEYSVNNSRESTWCEIIQDEPMKLIPNENIKNELRIIKRQPEIKIMTKHDHVAFIDEIFPIELEILNAENENIHAYLSVMCIDCVITENINEINKPLEQMKETLEYINIGVIPGGQSIKKMIYIFNSNDIGNKELKVKVEYFIENKETKTQLLPSPKYYSKSYDEMIDFKIAFEISTNVIFQNQYQPFEQEEPTYSLDLYDEEIESEDEELIEYNTNKIEYYKLEVTMYTNNVCKCDIDVMELILKKPSIPGITLSYSILGNVDFKSIDWEMGTKVNYFFLIKVVSDVSLKNNVIDLGDLLIRWKRNPSYQMFNIPVNFNQSLIPLHNIEVNAEPIKIAAAIPSDVYLGEVFTLTYYITNLTLSIEELSITMNSQNSFSFSGYKQTTFDLLPLSTHILHYNLYPLTVGHLKLPEFNIQCKTQNINPKICSTKLAVSQQPHPQSALSSSSTYDSAPSSPTTYSIYSIDKNQTQSLYVFVKPKVI
ncbi:hypothetical protein BCR32DRAFT_267562 [Anaeromyces robustus]|uniref:Trafficking protein particle complex subunit 11 domain-containing protein n=1 Tax=Anaeromyces robustus TaxID=1754192 RepID=A0A1Y1XB22_9FUNG|nr:hypothetical protein BCR32DRAFT_267562 [Anaeromyces robustus]|eukprot:ORX82554.1 hypothetical protein BCR32DRAFT_267562 [Anaeromyces robustus]